MTTIATTEDLAMAERMAAVREERAARFAAEMAAYREEIADLPPLLATPAPTSRSIGWSVHSATVRDPDDFPIGGVVVDLIEGADPETGEKYRRYLTVHRYGRELAWAVIDEADVGEASPPNALFLVDTIRALLQEVCMNGCRPRTGATLSVEHRGLIAQAMHLVGVL